MLRPDRLRGFTLLELLVAVAILALVAAGAYRLLFDTINTRDQGLARERALRELHQANLILQRDLLQAVQRPIRDEFGDEQPGFSLNEQTGLEFTRRGWRNPLQEPRSDLVRVRYRLLNGQLVREHWRMLDRVRASTPVQIVLLDKVSEMAVQVYAGNSWTPTWPPLAQNQRDPRSQPLPEAVELRFRHPTWGEVRRVILLPETANAAPPSQG